MKKKLPSTKYLQLPFQFNEDKLVNDLQSILSDTWKAHHYMHNYEGNWNSIALYSINGKHHNIAVHEHTHETLQETEVLKKCLYFKKVINEFQCPLQSVRLLRLTSESVIKPHKDFRLGYENGNFRLHIPITTNQDVSFILDDEQITMLPGECWYTNVNFTHSVANKGQEDRVHLVVDGERNEWSDRLFFSLAPKESFALQNELSKETIEMMIESLKQQNEPASKELLIEYQKRFIDF